jgi:hypothetical protein
MIATTDILSTARKLIEAGWIQDTFAEDMFGNPVYSTDAAACRWCLSGALNKADDVYDRPGPLAVYAFEAIKDEIGEHDIEAWNDAPDRTQDEVLALIDRVIAKLTR